MRASDSQSSPRRFIAWAIAGALLTWAGMAGLNLFVDPLVRFGFAYQFWFNSHYSASAFNLRTFHRGPYLESMGKRQAQTYLLGSSRFMVGFDTCDQPQNQKVSLGGASMKELADAQMILLSHATRPSTVITEMAGAYASSAPPMLSPLNRAFGTADLGTSLLGAHTTVASLKTVFRNLTATSAPSAAPDCSSGTVFFGDRVKHKQEEWIMVTAYEETRPENPEDLQNLWLRAISSAEEICHRQGLRHKIRWVMLPFSLNYWSNPFQKETAHLWQQAYEGAMQSDRPNAGSCDIDLTSYALDPDAPETQAWREEARWEDYNHFGSSLGALILAPMLEQQALNL